MSASSPLFDGTGHPGREVPRFSGERTGGDPELEDGIVGLLDAEVEIVARGVGDGEGFEVPADVPRVECPVAFQPGHPSFVVHEEEGLEPVVPDDAAGLVRGGEIAGYVRPPVAGPGGGKGGGGEREKKRRHRRPTAGAHSTV